MSSDHPNGGSGGGGTGIRRGSSTGSSFRRGSVSAGAGQDLFEASEKIVEEEEDDDDAVFHPSAANKG